MEIIYNHVASHPLRKRSTNDVGSRAPDGGSKKIAAELVTSILAVCDCSQGTATSMESMYIIQ